MKILLVGINAKFIHPNLAIRLLQANTTFPIDLMEWTIKDDPQTIANAILQEKPDVVGISCYIWNIESVKELLLLLRKNTSSFILLGGPEVSFNPLHYIHTYHVNAILCGESELSFPLLLNAIQQNLSFQDIPGLVTGNLFQAPTFVKDLHLVQSPYYLPCDYTKKIVYMETSRGCPFHCSYCLASLENHVRFFDMDRVKKDLLYLFQQGAKTFKFLDRTFNADIKRAKDLFSFLIENHPEDSVFQFEITGDIFPASLIDFINESAPAHLFRFEIGIQSIYEKTNRLIDRKQNTATLFAAIKQLTEGGKVDLHLDLIAGLPNENLSQFENSFNKTIAFKPKECQLGFLKILKGTKLEQEIKKYGYEVNQFAPYEIIKNDVLSEEDIAQIHLVEKVVDKCYNTGYMKKTMSYLIDHCPSFFQFCLDFNRYFSTAHNWLQYNLDDLFKAMFSFIKTKQENTEEILFLMKMDYLTHFKIKPKIWWQQQAKTQKNSLLETIYPHFLTYLPKEDIRKYGIIETFENQLFFIYYKQNDFQYKLISLPFFSCKN